MKRSIILPLLVLSLLVVSCNKTSPEQNPLLPQQEQSLDKDNENKQVELNPAQYKAAEITLGQIQDRNLSDVLRVNGQIKLPPEDEAEVSTFLSGSVTQILVGMGQSVKKGQLLATIKSPELVQLQEQYLVSKNNLEFLELEYQRQQTLRQENVNSLKTYQKIKSDLNIEKARYQSLTNQLKLVHVQPGSNSTSLNIISPITGNVANIWIKIGSNISSGQALFNIVDNTKVHLDLMVYEKDINLVKVGQKVSFNLTNTDNQQINATIFSIGKAFEPGTKTIAVHAAIDSLTQNLIPGFYVNALIHTAESNLPSLPNTAIVKAEAREFIFVLINQDQDDFHFERLEIMTGVSELGYSQVKILSTLPENAQIVLTGAYYLQSHLIKNESGGAHDH
ncbi:efflux RND transporter periplasmic adaptor subunit [Myroides sp. LJL110]